MKQKARGLGPGIKAGLVFHDDRWNTVWLFLWTALLFETVFEHFAESGDGCPYQLGDVL